jgi:hypothetical protein
MLHIFQRSIEKLEIAWFGFTGSATLAKSYVGAAAPAAGADMTAFSTEAFLPK